MRRIPIAVLALLISATAYAQTGSVKTQAQLNTETGSPSCSQPTCQLPDNTTGQITPFNLRQVFLDVIATLFGSTSVTNSVPNNTALKAACTGTSGCPAGNAVFPNGVWRTTWGNGNGAEPLWYNTSSSACSIAAGAGDDGLQVKSADGKCWIAQFPAAGASVLQFGAIGDGSTNNSTALQNAISDLPTNGYRIVVPAATGVYCLVTGLTVPTNASADFAPVIVGFGRQSSIISACNHDITVMTWSGQYGRMSDLALYGRGANATDTFSFTQPVLHLQSVAGNNRFSNLLINGGLYNVQLDGAANFNFFDNDAIFNAYGGAEVYLGNANATYFIHTSFDQSAPTVPLSAANATINAWASGQAYAANTIVTVSGYYIQCLNCNGVTTSSGSAPALKPYGASTTNGSDTLNWQLLGPVVYSAINCDTSCGIVNVLYSDMAGPFSHAVYMSNSASGSAGTGVTLNTVTISFTMGNGVQLDAGSYFNMRGGSIQSCALASCAGILTESAWSTGVVVEGVAFGGNLGYCVIDGAGTNFVFAENNCAATIVGGHGFLAQGAVTDFVVANNAFPNLTGTITTAAAAENHYSIISNLLNGGTVVDGGTGTDKLIQNAAGQLLGTQTNDGANAGNVGEYVVSGASAFNNVGIFGATVTITIATPAVISWTGNPYFLSTATGNGCASLVTFSTTGSLPTGITPGTNYYVTCDGTFTANAFHISDTVAHAIAGINMINTSGTQSGTQTGSTQFGLTTATPIDFGGLSLTPGDWDVTVVGRFGAAASTSVTLTEAGVSAGSALTNTFYSFFFNPVAAEVPGGTSFNSGSVERISIATKTTFFCGISSTFTVSTMTGTGLCRARRVR